MATTSLGFNVPTDDTVKILDWDVSVDKMSVREEESTASSMTWTDRSTVDVHFELDIALDKILEQIYPGPVVRQESAVLGAVINWKSSRTGLHGVSQPIEVAGGLNLLDLTLSGALLGGDLNLAACIVLLNPPSPTVNDLGPTVIGSRLWEKRLRVQLEGAGSQFPTSAFDFEKAGFAPARAMWKIDIDSALESHISSAVRLKLNTGHPRVAEYLADPTGKAQSEFQRFLRADTIIQMVTFALNSDLAQLETDAEEEGTLAETLVQMHKMYFPGFSIHSTKERFRDDPSFIASTVQSVIFDPKRRIGK